jgi:hypothetical protein
MFSLNAPDVITRPPQMSKANPGGFTFWAFPSKIPARMNLIKEQS